MNDTNVRQALNILVIFVGYVSAAIHPACQNSSNHVLGYPQAYSDPRFHLVWLANLREPYFIFL